jgi:hypothetical protein
VWLLVLKDQQQHRTVSSVIVVATEKVGRMVAVVLADKGLTKGTVPAVQDLDVVWAVVADIAAVAVGVHGTCQR